MERHSDRLKRGQLGSDSDDITNTNIVDCVLEVTINIPRSKEFKSMTLIEQIDEYKRIWKILKETSVSAREVHDMFHIEYCKTGLPHLHGYLRLKGCIPHFNEGMVMDHVRAFYKQIPARYWRQISAHPYNENLSRYRAPAICINYKQFLHENWEGYIKKCV